jgi:hypothetical protein
VIDNVVWTDYWLSIAGAGCGLTDVGAGEEQARKVIVRGTRWPAASSAVKCDPMDGFLVEPQN